jgi:hypothetical protein
MNQIKNLIAECIRSGITLEPRGDLLFVTSKEAVTPQMFQQIRAHTREIILFLESQRRESASHLVKQIVLGEFQGCDNATRKQLTVTLRQLESPLARQALEYLNYRAA